MSAYSDYLKTLGTWSGTKEEWNESLFNAGMTKAAEKAEAQLADAAGINSPHNACMFRENCRKAAAEIERLRRLVDEAPIYFAPQHDFDGKKLLWLNAARKDTK